MISCGQQASLLLARLLQGHALSAREIFLPAPLQACFPPSPSWLSWVPSTSSSLQLAWRLRIICQLLHEILNALSSLSLLPSRLFWATQVGVKAHPFHQVLEAFALRNLFWHDLAGHILQKITRAWAITSSGGLPRVCSSSNILCTWSRAKSGSGSELDLAHVAISSCPNVAGVACRHQQSADRAVAGPLTRMKTSSAVAPRIDSGRPLVSLTQCFSSETVWDLAFLCL